MAFRKLTVASLAVLTGVQAHADIKETFEVYKEKHNKVYADDAEEATRLKNFHASLSLVEEHNAKEGQSWWMGLNQFSDMSDEEFEEKVLMKPQEWSSPEDNNVYVGEGESMRLPAELDWRKKGVVGEVKNQGQCGSCWAFAVVGAMESHMALKYEAWRAPKLSEQQLVECAWKNHGCGGGWPASAIEYIKSAGGLSTEFSYPYKAADGKCHFKRPSLSSQSGGFEPHSVGVGGIAPGGSVNLTRGDEKALKYHLATKGPVTVAFQVASDFRHYKSGVYSSTVCKNGPQDMNHAVLVIGYGTDSASGKAFWTVKNSWDYTFGMDGFFKIEAFKNMCGIANAMAYPDVNGTSRKVMEEAAKQPVLI